MSDYPWPVHPGAGLFPELDGPDLADLADDIRGHGLREAVWLYDDPDRGLTLLDGRNRWRACQVAGVDCRTRTYTGTDPIRFSVSLNLKRRHLTAGQRAFLALEIEKLYAAETDPGGRPRKDSEKPKADLPDLKPWQRQSRERAAVTTGASGRAVAQAKRIADAAPDLAAKVRSGTVAIDRAERIIRDRDADRRHVERARAEAAALDAGTSVDIRAGDFREVLADLRDVDAIITDPPYGFEFLPLFGDLGAWADKVLKPGGVLAVLMGQIYLPDVFRLLDGARPYRWTACYLTPGPGDVLYTPRVQSNWKPLLIYGGGPRFADVFRSEGTDAAAKSLHHWGQDYRGFHSIVSRLTDPGQTVADPFMGSGTTLLAAQALGRHAVGADLDPAAVATARERLG
jgi:predicted RNA methylase